MTPWRAIREATRDSARAFAQALRDPAAAQLAELHDIVSSNARSAIGEQFGFDTIDTADDYRARVPVHRYDDLSDRIHAICDGGEPNVLTSEPIVFCEQTSGTSATPRLIPYTRSALAQFQRAIHPWLHDALNRWPALDRGRAYFAISPALRRARRTRAGIALGADSDGIYFGPALSASLEAIGAVPMQIARVNRLDAWRYLTLRCLLDADDLRLISVWSPSFFSTLLDALSAFGDRLVDDIASGRTTAPDGTRIEMSFEPRPARARAVRRALAGDECDTATLWPDLTLVSCWTHASAARFVPALARALPHAVIQGKGLLATEGVVSVPFAGNAYPVLALRSGFFEFVNERGDALLAHELELDATYRILITTRGGLYRYELGDYVRVRGFAAATPTLEFIGRADCVSDLCGEKITEAQVQRGLEDVEGFALLAPDSGDRPRYRLLLDAAERDPATARRIASRLDAALRVNPHYDYARRLGQLGPIVAETRPQPLAAYLHWQTRRGQRLGDIKPPVLHRDADLHQIFEAD